MAGPFDDFYTGAMTPPKQVPGGLAVTAVDPFTGQPIRSGSSAIAPVSNPVITDQMGVPVGTIGQRRNPDAFVPSSGEPFGNGTQMGFVPPGSMRLLPETSNPAVTAAIMAASGQGAREPWGPNWYNMPSLASARSGPLTDSSVLDANGNPGTVRAKYGNPAVAGALAARQPIVQTMRGTNGYIYARNPNGGWDKIGADPSLGRTPSEQYANVNAQSAARAAANATVPRRANPNSTAARVMSGQSPYKTFDGSSGVRSSIAG